MYSFPDISEENNRHNRVISCIYERFNKLLNDGMPYQAYKESVDSCIIV